MLLENILKKNLGTCLNSMLPLSERTPGFVFFFLPLGDVSLSVVLKEESSCLGEQTVETCLRGKHHRCVLDFLIKALDGV